MTPEGAPLVKVCGLARPQDAETAVTAGAAFLGVVLAPGGKRTVSAEAAREILAGLPAKGVGVFVDADADELARAGETAGLSVLQLHGDEPPELAARMRAAGWTVWKALRPRDGDEFVAGARRYAGSVDALLLDGWSAAARGGTGASFPWDRVAARLDALPPGVSLVAAGGLRPDNVGRAVRTLRPDVVDVSSGVEASPGIKDPAAVYAFVAAARGERGP